MHKIVFAAASIVLSTVVWRAQAQDHDHDHEHAHAYTGETAYYLAEHGDFEIGLRDGQLDLHIHLHAGAIVDGEPLAEDTTFEPSQLIVVATHEAQQPRPAGEIWHATGADVNEPLWVLPQHKQQRLPAMGLSTEEIELGLLVDDAVTLELRYKNGPGDVSLWADDAFGRPSFLLSTHEQKLIATVPAGLHAHYNWGFTTPGTYMLVFEAKGDLLAGGSTRTLAIYTFLVADGPILLHKPAADLNHDGVVDEGDLQILQDHLGQKALVWPHDSQHDEPENGLVHAH